MARAHVEAARFVSACTAVGAALGLLHATISIIRNPRGDH